GLVKLTAGGTPFPGFTPDPRLGRVAALAAMPDDSIALGMTSALILADGRTAALLRLLPNGTIDETAFPQAISTPGITMPRSTIAQLACQADGRLLMFSETYGGEVSTSTLSRRLPDLSVDSSFAVGSNYSVASPRLLPLADGRIFVGSKLLDAGGHLLEDIALPDQGSYSPQCQMADGAVVFTTLSQTGGTTSNRLVRWKSGTWDSSFEAAVNSPVGALGAVTAPDGKLYVTGWLAGGVPPGTQLVRLHRNGRLDAAFRPSPLTRQIRRGPGPWFTHTLTGLASFDPAARTSVDLTQWRTATGSEIMLDSSSARVIFKLLPGALRRFVRIEFIEP
ncbi:MAG: delta-60 repeat domain-containing protein, partial [Akkermansiaceae bacterium]|nr:delta-60 repeat domain-containing protein [Akkermansiaceae bacterium]